MKKNAVSITEHLTCLDPLDEHNSRQLIGMRLTRAKTLVAEKGNSFQKIFQSVDSKFKDSESSLPLTKITSTGKCYAWTLVLFEEGSYSQNQLDSTDQR